MNCQKILKLFRKDNLNKIILAHSNINSIRNKFDCLSEQVKGNIDILLISETKIDDSFSVGQFIIDGFSPPYRLDRSYHGGGLMLFVRKDIPSNLLVIKKKPIESFFIEINLRNSKWLINCSYNPHKNNITTHLDRSLDTFSSDYEKFIILGDFNVEINENQMKSFCGNYDLTNLIKEPTCYKNPTNPTCIDLIFYKCTSAFHSIYVVETGLSDFYLMTMTVMRKSFKKYQPSIISYRSYKKFSNAAFRETLIKKLSNENLVSKGSGFERFCDISLETSNNHAPCKKKHARGNQMLFLNKDLSKAIMTRTKLRNIFLQNRKEENKICYTKK